MKTKLKFSTSVLVGMLLIVLIPIQAAADASQTLVNSSTQVAVATSQLTVGDIDEKTAVRAGNHVRVEKGFKVLYDGVTGAEIARVAIGGGGSPRSATVSPYNTVTGRTALCVMPEVLMHGPMFGTKDLERQANRRV